MRELKKYYIRSTLKEARDYICENTERKYYEEKLNEKYYVYIDVGVHDQEDKFLRASIFPKGFSHLYIEVNPFALKDTYLNAMADMLYRCFEQIEKEESEKRIGD